MELQTRGPQGSAITAGLFIAVVDMGKGAQQARRARPYTQGCIEQGNFDHPMVALPLVMRLAGDPSGNAIHSGLH